MDSGVDSGVDAEVRSQLLAFAEQTTDFVGVSDPWGRILYLNPAARKRLGVADATGLTVADLFPMEAFGYYYDVVRPELLRTGAWSGEVLVNAAGGDAVPMYVSTTAKLGPGGATDGGVVYAHDLPRVDAVGDTDPSDVDEVTGLLGRSAFDEKVRDALATARRDGEACALVVAEVVGTNDLLEAPDGLTAASVMRALAGRMARLARTIDIAGRVGEQELGLLLGGVRSHGEALRIAQMVRASLVEPPVTTAGGTIAATVAVGVAVGNADDDPAALFERAAAAMSHEPAIRDLDARTSDRSGTSVTMDEFRVGMSHGEVRPYAERVVDLGSGLTVGYRGLARWHHRRLGTLEADAFIDMIADTPLVNEVDLYIARETAAVLALTVGGRPLRLYTPASRRLIADVRSEQYLAEIADAFFLSMHQICLQLARPLLEYRAPALRDALRSLRDADLTLAVTGIEDASDIRDLAEHPLRELHLSRRLTAAAETDPDARRTVAEIVRFAHDGDILVAARGVGNEQHRDVLVETGCDLASGDLYGRPALANTID